MMWHGDGKREMLLHLRGENALKFWSFDVVDDQDRQILALHGHLAGQKLFLHRYSTGNLLELIEPLCL